MPSSNYAPSPFACAVAAVAAVQPGRLCVVLVREPGLATWSVDATVPLPGEDGVDLRVDLRGVPALSCTPPMAGLLHPAAPGQMAVRAAACARLQQQIGALLEGASVVLPLLRWTAAFVDSLDWLGVDRSHPAGARGLEVQLNADQTEVVVRSARWAFQASTEARASGEASPVLVQLSGVGCPGVQATATSQGQELAELVALHRRALRVC